MQQCIIMPQYNLKISTCLQNNLKNPLKAYSSDFSRVLITCGPHGFQVSRRREPVKVDI